MGCGSSTASKPAINPPLNSPAAGLLKGEPSEPKRRGSYQSPELGAAGEGLVPLPQGKVGSWSNHGVKPEHNGRAKAKTNQDRGQITYPLAGHMQMALLCVYDGHGTCGEQVSEFVMLKMPDLLEAQIDRIHSDTENLFIECFEQTDRDLKASNVHSEVSGSTGVVVLLTPDQLYTANVGDSRAILGRQKGDKVLAIPLTEDQKPDSPLEQARILSYGGYVSPESKEHGPARVWLRAGEGPGLAMARSFGDHMCSHVGVVATPEVKKFNLLPEDRVIIIASDGVWEFISNDEAIRIVCQYTQNATDACIALINEATHRWRKEEGNYRDDITCIVVFLPCLPDANEPLGQSPSVAPERLVKAVSDEEMGADVPAGAESDNFIERRLTLAGQPTEEELRQLASMCPEKEDSSAAPASTW